MLCVKCVGEANFNKRVDVYQGAVISYYNIINLGCMKHIRHYPIITFRYIVLRQTALQYMQMMWLRCMDTVLSCMERGTA